MNFGALGLGFSKMGRNPFEGGGLAVLLAGASLTTLAVSFIDMSLEIRDPVTPANNYSGPLLTGTTFKKFTYSRASTAMYVGSNGLLQTAASGVPRFDYDPVTLAYKGFLSEVGRTNLALQSQTLDNATWVKNDVTVTADAQTAPDGTTTADSLVEAATTTIHFASQGSITLAASISSYSCWMKQGTQRYGFLRVIDSALTEYRGVFDLQAGTSTFTNVGTTAAIQQFANGWYRCVIFFTPAAGVGSINVGMNNASGDIAAYLGSGLTIHAWGAQYETLQPCSSYIPTTTVAVTRAADALTIGSALFNLNSPAGSLYMNRSYNFGSTYLAGSRFSMQFNDGTSNERAILYNSSGLQYFAVNNAAVNQAFMNGGAAIADGVFSKQAACYALNDFALSHNGAAVTTDLVGTPPAGLTQMIIGSHFGTIKDFAYFGERLTNARLQELAT